MTDKKVDKITYSNVYNNPQLGKTKKGEDVSNSVFSEEQLKQYKREEKELIAQLQRGGGAYEAQQLQKVRNEIETIKKQLKNEEKDLISQLQKGGGEDEAKQLQKLKQEIEILEKDIDLEDARQMTPKEAARRKVAQEAFAKKQNSFLNLSEDEQEVLEKDATDTLELLLDSGKKTIAEQDKEDGWVAKTANKVREFFGGKNTKENVELQFQSQEKFINELKQANSPEEFARIYKENTGVEFNPEKIQKFQEAKNYSTIANAGLAKCSEFQEALKRETFTGQDLINATRKFYGCSQEEAIAKLNEYAKNEKSGRYSFDKNGNLSVKSTVFSLKGETEVTKTYKPSDVGSEIKSHKEGDIISQAYNGFSGYAAYCTEQYRQNFEKATGKTIKGVSEDYSKYAKEALGTSGFNGELVNSYCEKQETVADRVSTGVSIAGMTMMLGGYAAAPVTGGASIPVAQVGTGMALGGQFLDEGLDLADELTSENGLSKEEGLALLKETATDAALVSLGFAINKVSGGVNQLVLSKMGSKVVAKAAEVGVDASLGIISDYIITGDINLTGEGISQGISIITGISMGKLASANVKVAPARNTQPDFQRISPNSNDFEIDGTVIKNPKKTPTTFGNAKNASEMNIFERAALGMDEAATPKKIILSDSVEPKKPLILGDETSKNQRIILDNEAGGDVTRSYTNNGYTEEQYKSLTANGFVKNEIRYDSQENTFKTTETKAHSKNWEMNDKDVTVTDTKYTSEGVLKSRTTQETHTDIINGKEVVKGKTLTSENYIDGSKIRAEYVGDNPDSMVLKSQVKTYKNSKTGLPETHVMELSDVPGIYNSKIIDANGNEKIECSAQKIGGTTKVEKNLESLNGTKTHYTHESKFDGDDVKTFYQITSKDGEVLSTINRSFTRIDKNTAVSEINGHRYTMKKVNVGIEVEDIARGTTTTVKYSDVLKNANDSEMKILMDKMSGDQLLDLKNQGTKLSKSNVDNSFYSIADNEIISENNLFAYSHEAGHAKDLTANEKNNYITDYAISNEKQFRQTFEREKAAFKKAFPDVQEDYIDYFIKGPYNDSLAGAGETVAEINAMFSTATGANTLAMRTYELQKYFPETIALASRRLNADSNIAISGDTKLNPKANNTSAPRTNNSEYKILYSRPVAQGSADPATIKKIDDLMEYNENIRKKPSKITLDRNPIYDCDIPYQPDSYYRVIGEDGWKDFNESNTLRPKQVSKENYQVAYFEKGRANSIYARSESSQAYIAETNSSMIKVDSQHYPFASEIPSDEPIRIWHKTANGYEIVYDTMNDVVSKNDLRYGKTAAQKTVVPEAVSAKLKNFNVSDADYSYAVQKYGAEQTAQNIELLSQLKSLNMFKDADLTLEDVPRIYGVIKGYAENTLEADFKPEDLLSSKELKIDANSDARLDIEITRDVDFDTIQKIYKSLNPDYKRAIDNKYLTDIGNKRNVVCMESDIANAKSITPANQQKFVDSLVESNMITDKLIAAYDNMLKSNDVLAKEIAARVNEKPLILTDNAGMETTVYFKDLYNKAKTNPESLTPSEIHGITDVFKNEVRINKASVEFFDNFMDAEIKVKGELKPEYKQIAGVVDAMKNSSASVLKGSDIEIGEHAFMRLIDRDLINPTNKNGEIVSFKTLVEAAKTEISKRDAKDSLKNIVLSDLYSSEGKPISLIVKRVNGKIMIESFM